MKITISVRLHFTKEQIANLLDSASRGADYWADNELMYESETDEALTKEGVWIEDTENESVCDCTPIVPKSHHETCPRVEALHNLNVDKIKKGLTSMAKKNPKHFADFLSEDFDADTGDVFLQHCLFGEVIYG